jgi:hypothetical protein
MKAGQKNVPGNVLFSFELRFDSLSRFVLCEQMRTLCRCDANDVGVPAASHPAAAIVAVDQLIVVAHQPLR